jgi:hypothetical protein
MSNYRKTMADALQEMYPINEDNIDLMRKAAGGAAQTVKMKDGKLQMDMFTASAIMKVFDKVNPANQKKMAVMINKGTKDGMMKLQDFAMKQVKSENDPEIEEEVDLDEAILKDRDYEVDEKEGVVKISKKNFAKVSKDAKGTDKSKPTMMVLTKKGTSLYPVKFTEEVDLDEAIKVGDNVKVKLSRKGREYIEKGKVTEIEKDSIIVKHDFSRTPSKVKMTDIVKEEADLDENRMSQLHQMIKDKKSAAEIAKEMKLDVKTVKALMNSHHPEDIEESAASDARRAMSRDKDFSRRDTADDDTGATDADVKGASKNIIMQLRKAGNRASMGVEFGDGKKVQIPAKMALAVQQKYNSLKKPADKEKFQAQIAKSYKDMLKVLKSGYGEQKESILERMNRKIKENKDG